ncbi:MAG: colicin immunity domain-containing protein [Sciscionella sp.]
MAEVARNIIEALVPYRDLLTQFVSGTITADQLETRYIALYTDDPTEWPEEVFRVLDSYFFDVDDYVVDDALRAEVGGIDAAQLQAKAAQTLARLDALDKPAGASDQGPSRDSPAPPAFRLPPA